MAQELEIRPRLGGIAALAQVEQDHVGFDAAHDRERLRLVADAPARYVEVAERILELGAQRGVVFEDE